MAQAPGTRGLVMEEPVIFARSTPGRAGYSVGAGDVPEADAAGVLDAYLRTEVKGLPEVSEPEVVRHYTRISQWNYSIDTGMFPLGSCTMKYNPRTTEAMARLGGFAQAHPYLPPERMQGVLWLMHELAGVLGELSGFDGVTLQPAAGAQGELTGLKMIRAWQEARGEGARRRKVLVTDTAHGTNPASSTLNGYVTEPVASEGGILRAEAVARAMGDDVAGLMITIPNTLGLFEREIAAIADVVHRGGGQVYCDGANFNALLGRARPGDWGVDVMQFNLHKTFSTPHGGGGPGSGPVGFKAHLEAFQPVPVVVRRGEAYALEEARERPRSVGRLRTFFGNFGMLVRAYAYVRELGAEGLTRISGMAVLNANYLRVKLEDRYHVAYPGTCMHEVVFSDRHQKAHGVTTLDVAKRLMDKGYHPPTVYFPLVVPGALMTEPTESETRRSLDEFVAAMREIADEAERDPELLHAAPHLPVRRRFDEAAAARRPVLVWRPDGEGEGDGGVTAGEGA